MHTSAIVRERETQSTNHHNLTHIDGKILKPRISISGIADFAS